MFLDDGDSCSAFGSRPDLHRIIDTPLPDWVVVGESVQIRPYNSSGVVAYVGPTEFSTGTWIGVELDAPTGNLFDLYNIKWMEFYAVCLNCYVQVKMMVVSMAFNILHVELNMEFLFELIN